MHECCEIFSLSYSEVDRRNCSMECLAERGDVCCYDECFVEKTGLMWNNVLNSSNLNYSITRGGEVGEAEIKVVEDSMKKCANFLQETKTQTDFICRIPPYVYLFVQCVLKNNYLNCPNVQENQGCKELGKVLMSCRPITTTLPPPTKKKQ